MVQINRQASLSKPVDFCLKSAGDFDTLAPPCRIRGTDFPLLGDKVEGGAECKWEWRQQQVVKISQNKVPHYAVSAYLVLRSLYQLNSI